MSGDHGLGQGQKPGTMARRIACLWLPDWPITVWRRANPAPPPPETAFALIERAAGGFFDVLDVDQDGCLVLADLQAYAAAYAKPTAGIAANLTRLLDGLGLPAEQPRDRLSRENFLILVNQYWFDPSPDSPGRGLFDLEPG